MTKPKKEGRSYSTMLKSTSYLFPPQFLHRSLSNQVLFHLKIQAEFKNKYMYKLNTYLNPTIPVLAIA